MKYKYKIIKKEKKKEKKARFKQNTNTHTATANIQKHSSGSEWKKILIHIATIINARNVKLMLVVTFRKFKVNWTTLKIVYNFKAHRHTHSSKQFSQTNNRKHMRRAYTKGFISETLAHAYTEQKDYSKQHRNSLPINFVKFVRL